MGTCLSKKDSSSSSSASPPPAAAAGQAPASTKHSSARTPGSPAPKKVPIPQSKQEAAGPEEESFVKKEVFVIKHRKSHDRDTGGRVVAAPPSDPVENLADGSSRDASEATGNNVGAAATLAVGAGIRTSSCTKEEVESILIQCGRLSHSGSSSGKPTAASSCPASGGRSRRYSGSKRSYDFDHSSENDGRGPVGDARVCDEDEVAGERQRHRQLSRPSSGSQGSRRRTPSRERDQQRSRSTERRRVSRSPGRRSEITSAPAASAAGVSDKPGKLVSVPASVPSSAEPPVQQTSSVRRISVKRNVGEGGRSAASPRSQSPARAKEGPQQAPLSLSRNSSRKAEHSPYRRNLSSDPDHSRKPDQSPYRRNPANDIDPSRKTEQSPHRRNTLSEIDNYSSSAPAPPSNKVGPHVSSRVLSRNNKENEGLENINITQVSVLKPNVDLNSRKAFQGTFSKASYSKETEKLDSGIGSQEQQLQAAAGEAENQKPQKLTKSRSARRSSGHIEFNPEIPSNHSSYTNLLLEDIQNFHQTNPGSISLPDCVNKAHSIFQAVADLNSNTAANISSVLSEDKRAQPQPSYQLSTNCFKDPFVESEVGIGDDLMEPSMHKYVTVKRGSSSTTPGGGDREELESSGSNSFVGGIGTMHNQWEPGSADSSDCWTSSSTSRTGLPSNYLPEDDARRKMSGKMRDGVHEQNGIGRGRVRCR
ncbi:uncharacterized protein At1g65710-like [Punica granatum]|uniref:Serine/arginine repetitive matrix protein 2-like n=2 Tax=Punica granatum TaxID=22663 RepID=A0A218XKF5_PUNGR|nr:uncharacterized protein At1g65710-like [Punica granatum]OWM84951.1 hypothetical protein CDL15_Pgr027738 [Punica granatum]PKI45980.1 hypothetical protein CRG98_033620 [Punica granatum]